MEEPRIDQTVYTGRPKNTEGRLEKEIAVYDFLDSLGIEYKRADHEALMTMEACEAVDQLLGAQICKNLFSLQPTENGFLSAADAGREAVLKQKFLFQTDRNSQTFLCRRRADGGISEHYTGVLKSDGTDL